MERYHDLLVSISIVLVYINTTLLSHYLSGELDQSNVTEENPEGEEHPAADSENK